MKRQTPPILLRPDSGFQSDNMEIHYKNYYDNSVVTDHHWHDYYEMEIIVNGTGTYYVNGTQYSLKRGSAYLVTPVDFHQLRGNLVLYNIAFNELMVSDELIDLLMSDSCATVAEFGDEDLALVETLLKYLSDEYTGDKALRTQAMKAMLESILISYLRHTGLETAEQGKSDVAVMRVVAYIKFNFKKKLTLGEVAEAVHLTPNYVGEIFSKKMGVSFNQYLMQTRLNYAKNLLMRGGMSIQEVALDSGFGSQTYFSDCFKKEFGYTPTEIKKTEIFDE